MIKLIKKDTLGSIYKVELLSRKKLALEPRNYKALQNISLVYEDNNCKHIYGETSGYVYENRRLINLITEVI